jgi:eukaryotic-like serine/threonine-protein kinase
MTPRCSCSRCGTTNHDTCIHCFACGHPLAGGPDGEKVDQQVLLQGRYRLIAMLGSGGFSVVYRAQDTWQNGHEVALKQINLQGLSAEEIIEATHPFHREVSALSSLNHSQIPRIYDHFSDQNHWYLILEYIAGLTLEHFLASQTRRGKTLQLTETLDIVLQLCRVLEYLHSHHPPIVFRDLKPSNIICTPTGTFCLIDFGIARHFIAGQLHDTQPLGSPGYAAPEQYGRAQTTPQADIYSLGVLLHFLLSGQDPVDSPLALPPLHLESQPAGATLEKLVARMLALHPNERTESIREGAETLKQVKQEVERIWLPSALLEYPGSERPVLPRQPTLFTRRRALVSLGVLATVVSGGSVVWSTTRARPQSARPGSRSSQAIGSHTGHTAAVSSVAWSPDNTRIASASQDTTVQIWRVANPSTDVITYRGHQKSVNSVAWSSDGMLIASGSSDGTTQLWSPDAQVIQRFNTMVTERTAAWSPDNQHLAIAGWDVLIWDRRLPQGGEIDYYVTNEQGWANQGVTYSVAWAPDGHRFVAGFNDQTVRIWDISTSTNLVTWNGTGNISSVAWAPDGRFLAFAGAGNVVQVRNAESGEIVLLYKGHTGVVSSLAWSPDSTLLTETIPIRGQTERLVEKCLCLHIFIRFSHRPHWGFHVPHA